MKSGVSTTAGKKRPVLPIAHRVSEVKARARPSLVGPGSPLWGLALLDMKYGTSSGLQEETFAFFQSGIEHASKDEDSPTLAIMRCEAFSSVYHRYWSRKLHE